MTDHLGSWDVAEEPGKKDGAVSGVLGAAGASDSGEECLDGVGAGLGELTSIYFNPFDPSQFISMYLLLTLSTRIGCLVECNIYLQDSSTGAGINPQSMATITGSQIYFCDLNFYFLQPCI